MNRRHIQPRDRVHTLAFVLALAISLLALAACSSRPGGPTATPTALPPTALPAPGTDLPATPVVPTLETPQQPLVRATSLPAATPAATPPARGNPDRLVIPKIDLDTPIVDVGWDVVQRGNQRYTEWQTADNAAGRHINSARPGETGNVVLSGHHNTKGEVFRRISEQELAVGDALYLYDSQGRRHLYQVTEVTEPLPEVGASEAQRLANARYIQPTSDARVTLVTCWPYWTNTHRIVVVGKLVP